MSTKTDLELKRELRAKLNKMSLEELDAEMDKTLDRKDSVRFEVTKEIKEANEGLLQLFDGSALKLQFQYAGPIAEFFTSSVNAETLTFNDIKVVQLIVRESTISKLEHAKAIRRALIAYKECNQAVLEIEELIGFIAEFQVTREQEEETGLSAEVKDELPEESAQA